jgi:hypothetical protein
MLNLLQVVAVLLVSIAMALALAHALELPGKMRLSKDAYMAVQPIYYPGFTIGGAVGELGGLIALVLLVVFTPWGTRSFWLSMGSLAALAAAHAAYWFVTHPVNNFWLEGVAISRGGARFFATDPLNRGANLGPTPWTELRDRWEHSHVLRAALAFLSLTLLVVAVSL